MIPSRVIERKRDGARIPASELEAFLGGFMRGEVADYQMAAFLMAVYFSGLDAEETETLVRCMLGSGASLDLSHLPGPRVDKHSTGGVGDKVSLVLAPLAAAMGLYVPMMSGRGLAHTAGTLDKLEAIPGFRTQLDLEEFLRVLEDVGCAMIGQTAEVAPLDRRLYALRDVTATVPVIPLIAASIMSKKLAEDLDGLVLDVKVGSGAFIPEEERAMELARAMVAVGAGREVPTVALITAMDRPLGRAVGNALETAEALAALRGEGPEPLRELVLTQVVEMACLGWPEATRAEMREGAEDALSSGAALERATKLIEAQGGDPAVVERPGLLGTAALTRVVEAKHEGWVHRVEPRALGEGVVALGGGRRQVDDEIDLTVGFEVDVAPGDRVESGRPLGVVHARDEDGAAQGEEILRGAVRLSEERPPAARALVSHRVGRTGGVELLADA